MITSALADAVLDGRSRFKEQDAVVEEMVEQAMEVNPEEGSGEEPSQEVAAGEA